jgi:hypothetical protein
MSRRSTRPVSAIGHVERLEGRVLMAADVTATLNNGVLSITGTDLRDETLLALAPSGLSPTWAALAKVRSPPFRRRVSEPSRPRSGTAWIGSISISHAPSWSPSL